MKIGILDRYYRPRSQIGEDVPVRTHLNDNTGNRAEFIAHRIVIGNTGRTAAKDCKAYIRIKETQIQRTAWMISSNDRPYTVTLNVQDLAQNLESGLFGSLQLGHCFGFKGLEYFVSFGIIP